MIKLNPWVSGVYEQTETYMYVQKCKIMCMCYCWVQFCGCQKDNINTKELFIIDA